MACGTPVIGANVGGIKYSVADGETGLLVNPHDPEMLADKINKIISHDDVLSRMGENAIYRVNTYFTWAKVAGKVLNLYNMLIQEAKETVLAGEESKAA